MDNPEIHIPEDIAPEVLALASRYYANQQQSSSIPTKFIQQALREVQAQRAQQQQQQQRAHKQRQIFLIIGACLLAVSSLWSIWTYNFLSTKASKVRTAWAQLDNQLQGRADLIPKLKQAILMPHLGEAHARAWTRNVEFSAFMPQLDEAHEVYLQAGTQNEKVSAITTVNLAIQRFRNYADTNPPLQSNQLLINLQDEIVDTETRLAVEVMQYNKAVQSYNQQIQQFPDSLIADTFGFQRHSFFNPFS
jgi:LemA protein